MKEEGILMKMRKLVASLAAAATLFGGLAFGATTANAAVNIDGKTITATTTDPQRFYTKDVTGVTDFTNQDGLRTFKYVKLAGYEKVANDRGVNLVNGLTDTVSSTTVADAFTALGYDDEAKKANPDPWNWFGNQNWDTKTGLDAFVNALAPLAITDITPAVSTDGKTLTFTFTDPGLYLVVDKSGEVTIKDDSAETVTWSGLTPLLAGTAVTAADGDTGVTGADGAFGTNGNVDVKSTPTTVKKGSVSWTKVQADGKTPLAGATFKVFEGTDTADATKALYFVAGTTDGTYTLADETTEGATQELTTNGTNGLFQLSGLQGAAAPGKTYTVVETKAPNGYSSTFLATFTFTITLDENGEPTTSYNGTDVWGLAGNVSNEKDDNAGTPVHPVKNVQNITQLPHTGAAGIAMFTVIGLLLAGAAGTVYLKSRKANALLRA